MTHREPQQCHDIKLLIKTSCFYIPKQMCLWPQKAPGMCAQKPCLHLVSLPPPSLAPPPAPAPTLSSIPPSPSWPKSRYLAIYIFSRHIYGQTHRHTDKGRYRSSSSRSLKSFEGKGFNDKSLSFLYFPLLFLLFYFLLLLLLLI